ncbi:MAG: MazG family protein [Caldilineaceae bacterium]
MAHLRAPEGCPWDQEQTLASLRQDLLGEAVEVLEAIDVEETGEDNSLHIAEELGDLLLLATMLIQIATEEGRFKMADVAQHIVHKLIRRHPHVFGDAEVESLDDIFTNWDAIKAEEKAAKGQPTDDPLAGVPPHLPALEKARKLQSKAQKAGLLDRAALAADNPTLKPHSLRTCPTRTRWAGCSGSWWRWPTNATSTPRTRCVRTRWAFENGWRMGRDFRYQRGLPSHHAEAA